MSLLVGAIDSNGQAGAIARAVARRHSSFRLGLGLGSGSGIGLGLENCAITVHGRSTLTFVAETEMALPSLTTMETETRVSRNRQY